MRCAAMLLCVMAVAAAPTTQLHSVSESDALRSEIKILRAEITRLKAENARLRTSAAAAGDQPGAIPTQQPQGQSTFTSRTKKRLTKGIFGFDQNDMKAAIAHAEEIDRNIDAYLATHPQPDSVAKAIRNGWVEIGMPKDAVRLFGEFTETFKSANGSAASLLIWDPEDLPVERQRAQMYNISFDKNGLIVSFDVPAAGNSVVEPRQP